MVIGEIEEDTKNLRKAKEIGNDLKSLTIAFGERGESLKGTKREELLKLEQEENDLARKLREQEREIDDFDRRINQAQDDIAANRSELDTSDRGQSEFDRTLEEERRGEASEVSNYHNLQKKL